MISGTVQLLDPFDRKTRKFRHVVLDASTPSAADQPGPERRPAAENVSGSKRLDTATGYVKRVGHMPGPDDELTILTSSRTGPTAEACSGRRQATARGNREICKVSHLIPLRIKRGSSSLFKGSKGSSGFSGARQRAGRPRLRFEQREEKLVQQHRRRSIVPHLQDDETHDGVLGLSAWELPVAAQSADSTSDQYVNDPTDPRSLSENILNQRSPGMSGLAI
jgi:hypothetical protein